MSSRHQGPRASGREGGGGTFSWMTFSKCWRVTISVSYSCFQFGSLPLTGAAAAASAAGTGGTGLAATPFAPTSMTGVSTFLVARQLGPVDLGDCPTPQAGLALDEVEAEVVAGDDEEGEEDAVVDPDAGVVVGEEEAEAAGVVGDVEPADAADEVAGDVAATVLVLVVGVAVFGGVGMGFARAAEPNDEVRL